MKHEARGLIEQALAALTPTTVGRPAQCLTTGWAEGIIRAEQLLLKALWVIDGKPEPPPAKTYPTDLTLALRAARTEARQQGVDPERLSPLDAWRYLDEAARKAPDSPAGRFYRTSPESQWEEWDRRWKAGD